MENDANPEELLNSGIINSAFFITEVLDIGYQTQMEYTWKLKCEEKQYWMMILYAFSPTPT